MNFNGKVDDLINKGNDALLLQGLVNADQSSKINQNMVFISSLQKSLLDEMTGRIQSEGQIN